MAIPPSGRVLALDWGSVRFGVAVSDETQLLASPVVTLTRRPGRRFPMPAFLRLCQELRPAGLVIGLPLTPEGSRGEPAEEALKLARHLGKRTGLPVEAQDERHSTARVLGIDRELGGSGHARHDLDARAAAVLLQQWLDTRRGGSA